MGKPAQGCVGGIAVTVHAVNRFRLRCPTHPILKKGTTKEIERSIRHLARRGDTVPSNSLKNGERLVRICYQAPRLGEQVAYVILAPSRHDAKIEAVLTVLTSDMVLRSTGLREHY